MTALDLAPLQISVLSVFCTGLLLSFLASGSLSRARGDNGIFSYAHNAARVLCSFDGWINSVLFTYPDVTSGKEIKSTAQDVCKLP